MSESKTATAHEIFNNIEIENEADLIAVLKKISPFFKWENIGRILEQGEQR